MTKTAPANILIITTHDSGRHFGCYDAAGVDTPHIDRFAAEGVQFDRCFTACPVCSPSRGAMMTGRYPQSNGLMGLTHQPWWWEMHADERHLSQILRDAGYATHLFGIQHESGDSARLAFDHIAPFAKEDGLNKNALEIADDALASMPAWQQSDQPFYAQIGFFESHTPYAFGGAVPGDENAVAAPPFVEDNAAARQHLAGLAGAVAQADAAVGRILDGLQQHGLAEDTLCIFTVDHGVELGRRAKWSCYDAGIEIALLMRWPNGIEGGRRSEELVGNVDVLPTLLELVGIDVPENVQGESFKGLLDGRSGGRELVYAMFTGNCEPRCVRSERYKLIRNFEASRPIKVPMDLANPGNEWRPRPFVELYDLAQDPHELNNIADDPSAAEVRDQLDAKLLEWMHSVGDPLLEGPVPTPYHQRATQHFTS